MLTLVAQDCVWLPSAVRPDLILYAGPLPEQSFGWDPVMLFLIVVVLPVQSHREAHRDPAYLFIYMDIIFSHRPLM